MGEIEMQTFGPEIGHQEGLTKAHNVSDLFCSRTATPTTHVMPLSCLLVNFGWKVTILANPGTDCVSAGVNWLLNGQFRRNFRRFIGGEFIWSVKCAGQALCLNRAALQCARFHTFHSCPCVRPAVFEKRVQQVWKLRKFTKMGRNAICSGFIPLWQTWRGCVDNQHCIPWRTMVC